MEKNITDEVVLLLFPLFFNKVNFENNKYNFLSFNEIIKNDPLFDFPIEFESTKDGINSLFGKIDDYDFSNYLLDKIDDKSVDSQKKVILVNFPNNIKQFETLSSKLAKKGKIISKVVVSNFETFENFEKLISNFFTCPFCLNSFEKNSCLSAEDKEKFLICPIDENKVSLPFSRKFIKTFSEHYLTASLNLAQSLSSIAEESEFYKKKPDIVPLIIPEVDQIEEFLINKMSEII